MQKQQEAAHTVGICWNDEAARRKVMPGLVCRGLLLEQFMALTAELTGSNCCKVSSS